MQQQQAARTAHGNDLFDALCERFGIDPKIGDHLVIIEGLETLNDLRHVSSDALDGIIARIPNLAKPALQTSRLRQAQDSIRNAAPVTPIDARRRGMPTPDEVRHIRSTVQRTMRDTFCARVEQTNKVPPACLGHLPDGIERYSPDQMPDILLSYTFDTYMSFELAFRCYFECAGMQVCAHGVACPRCQDQEAYIIASAVAVWRLSGRDISPDCLCRFRPEWHPLVTSPLDSLTTNLGLDWDWQTCLSTWRPCTPQPPLQAPDTQQTQCQTPQRSTRTHHQDALTLPLPQLPSAVRGLGAKPKEKPRAKTETVHRRLQRVVAKQLKDAQRLSPVVPFVEQWNAKTAALPGLTSNTECVFERGSLN